MSSCPCVRYQQLLHPSELLYQWLACVVLLVESVMCNFVIVCGVTDICKCQNIHDNLK